MTIVAHQSNQESNQFEALVSESEYDSEYDFEASESASVTLTRHTDYFREVQADQNRLLSVAKLRENDEDDDWETDIMVLKVVTVADLEGLCSETVSPIHDYDTIVLQ